MSLPTFIIIGAGRSGTTSLYHYLAQHPDVFMSPVKETEFFAWQAEWAGRKGFDEARCKVAYPVRDLAAYEALFAGAAGRCAIGEASPRYFYAPGVPEAMASLIPDARLIAILRDPAARALSAWAGHFADGIEDRSFEQAIDDELPLLDRPLAPGEMTFLRPGFYHRHLMRHLERFRRDRVLLILYDDFAGSTRRTLREVLRFLEVDETAPIDTSIRFNPTGIPRNAMVERLTAKSPLAGALKRHLPPPLRDPLYRAAMHLRGANRERPSVDPAMARRLRDIYREDTMALAQLLGRDLSAWLDPEAPL